MSRLSREEVLALLPHRPPMRFLSEIVELDEEHIVTRHVWTVDDCAGHFPGYPVVPGVKILESAAQASQAWFSYLLSATMPREDLGAHIGLFVGVEEARFRRMVRPGSVVSMTARFGEEGYLRASKFVSEVTGHFAAGPDEGEAVFFGRLAGMWLPREAADSGFLA